jgi:zinc transporter, ZIP family
MGIVVGSVVEGVTRVQDLGIQVERASRSVSASCGGVHLERPAGDRAVGRYRESGWARGRLGQLWFLAVLACGVAAALGFLATDVSGTVQGDRAAASLREGSLQC